MPSSKKTDWNVPLNPFLYPKDNKNAFCTLHHSHSRLISKVRHHVPHVAMTEAQFTYMLCRGGAATRQQVPPQADTATCCSAASCHTTRAHLGQHSHIIWNNKPCPSAPWRCTGTTSPFLALTLACLSLLHPCSRNAMNITQTVPV